MEMPARDPKRELLARLEAAPAEHAAALLDGYELLQAMHESGVFALARGALAAGTKMVDVAAGAANTPEAIRAMRNAILLGKLLAAIDPEMLESVCAAASQSLGDARTVAHEPPSTFALLGSLLSRKVRRVLGVGTMFLRSLADQVERRADKNMR
jgi:uncharacterized protein YjgD (DUF1641 family)